MSLRYDIFASLSGTIYTFDNVNVRGNKPSIRQNQEDFYIRIIDKVGYYFSTEPSAWDFTSVTVSVKYPDGTISELSNPVFQLVKTAPYGSNDKPAGFVILQGTKVPHAITGTYTYLIVYYKSGTAIASTGVQVVVTDTTNTLEKVSEHDLYFDPHLNPQHIHLSQHDSSVKLSFKIRHPDVYKNVPNDLNFRPYLQGRRPDGSELFVQGTAQLHSVTDTSRPTRVDSYELAEFSNTSQVTEIPGIYTAEIAFFVNTYVSELKRYMYVRQLTSQRIIFHIEPKP